MAREVWLCVIGALMAGCAAATTAKRSISTVEERFLTPRERWEKWRGEHLDALDDKLWPLLKATGDQVYARFGRPNRIIRKRTTYRRPPDSTLVYADEVWIYDGRRLGGPANTVARLYLTRGIVEHAEPLLVRR